MEEEERMGQMSRRQNLLGVDEEQLPRLVDLDQDRHQPLCPETEELLKIQTPLERMFPIALALAHWTHQNPTGLCLVEPHYIECTGPSPLESTGVSPPEPHWTKSTELSPVEPHWSKPWDPTRQSPLEAHWTRPTGGTMAEGPS